MLFLENINLTLGKNSQLERKTLYNLNLKMKPREFVVVIGGNGAGKSTMFNIISGFLKPDSGRIIINEQDVTSTPQTIRASLVSKVVQDPRVGTISNMTIFENLAFALNRGQKRSLRPFFNSARTKLFKEKLKALNIGLENRMDEIVGNLSGGQRQVLSLVMAMLADSKILLLDEITAALDPPTNETVMELTAKVLKEEKRTCIMVTHNLNHALKYGDRLLILKRGTFVKEFSRAERAKLTQTKLASHFAEV